MKSFAKNCVLLICIFALTNNTQAYTPDKFPSLKNKYGQDPQKKCRDAGCHTIESCYKLHVQACTNLPADQQEITQLKKTSQSWSSWIGLPTATEKEYETYLHNLTLVYNFINAQHKIFNLAESLIKFHEKMPQESAAFIVWMKKHTLHASDTPYKYYKESSQQNIAQIDALGLDKHQYPFLAERLQHTKEKIQHSLFIIEPDLQKEYDREHQRQLEKDENLRKNQLVVATQESVQAEKDKAQALERLVKKEDERINGVLKLATALEKMTQQQLYHQDLPTLQDIARAIATVEDHKECLSKRRHGIEALLTSSKLKLEDVQKYQKAIADLARIQQEEQQAEKKLKELEAELTSLNNKLTEVYQPTAEDLRSIKTSIEHEEQKLTAQRQEIGRLFAQKIQAQKQASDALSYKASQQKLSDVQKTTDEKDRKIAELKQDIQAPEIPIAVAVCYDDHDVPSVTATIVQK